MYFISYSRHNKEFVQEIVKRLEQLGIECWLDTGGRLEPGTPSWQHAILEAIENCRGIIIFATPNTQKSVWVTRELSAAEDYGKPIYPLWCDGDRLVSALGMYNTLQLLGDIRPLIQAQRYDEIANFIRDELAKITDHGESSKSSGLVGDTSNISAVVSNPNTSEVKSPNISVVIQPNLTGNPVEQYFVYVPAGECYIGENNQSVRLEEFYIGRYPVTRYQFGEFVKDTKYQTKPEDYQTGRHWTGDGYFPITGDKASWRHPYGKSELEDELPVTMLSRSDMQEYCSWLTKQLSSLLDGLVFDLPTEHQWEKAARGGLRIPKNGVLFYSNKRISRDYASDELMRSEKEQNNQDAMRRRNAIFPLAVHDPESRIYPWGDRQPNGRLARYGNHDKPTSTLDHANNISPYGCIQMAGNVREVCLGNGRSVPVRGGSFLFGEDKLKCYATDSVSDDFGYTDVGFRMVLNPTNK